MLEGPTTASCAAGSAQRVRAAGLPCPVPAAGSLTTDAELPSHFGLRTALCKQWARTQPARLFRRVIHAKLQIAFHTAALATSRSFVTEVCEPQWSCRVWQSHADIGKKGHIWASRPCFRAQEWLSSY